MGRNLCTIRGRNATKGFVRVELISNKFFRKPLLYQAQLLPGVYSRVSLGPNVLVVPFKSVSKNRIEQGICNQLGKHVLY